MIFHVGPIPEAVRFEVRGHVQGVGFRFFVLTAARDLGLRGWVCNRADGAVELVAVGSRSGLRQLEQRLRTGPPQAKVDGVVRRPEANAGDFTQFTIAQDSR